MTTQVMNLNIKTKAPRLTQEQWNWFYGELHAHLAKNFLSDKFTMFVVTLAEHTQFDYEKGDNYYFVGLDQQRELLEDDKYSYDCLNGFWKYLGKEFGRIAEDVKVTQKVKKLDFPEYDSMKNYFDHNQNAIHIAEKAILHDHFDLNNYHFFSISVPWEDQFHTAVHIILNEKDLRENFVNELGKLNDNNHKNFS